MVYDPRFTVRILMQVSIQTLMHVNFLTDGVLDPKSRVNINYITALSSPPKVGTLIHQVVWEATELCRELLLILHTFNLRLKVTGLNKYLTKHLLCVSP